MVLYVMEPIELSFIIISSLTVMGSRVIMFHGYESRPMSWSPYDYCVPLSLYSYHIIWS